MLLIFALHWEASEASETWGGSLQTKYNFLFGDMF